FAFDADSSAHELGESAADRQPQAGTLVLAGKPAVELLERLEQAVEVGRFDPRSGIAKAHAERRLSSNCVAGMVLCRQSDRAVLGEFHGVAQEVEQDLLEAPLIADRL